MEAAIWAHVSLEVCLQAGTPVFKKNNADRRAMADNQASIYIHGGTVAKSEPPIAVWNLMSAAFQTGRWHYWVGVRRTPRTPERDFYKVNQEAGAEKLSPKTINRTCVCMAVLQKAVRDDFQSTLSKACCRLSNRMAWYFDRVGIPLVASQIVCRSIFVRMHPERLAYLVENVACWWILRFRTKLECFKSVTRLQLLCIAAKMTLKADSKNWDRVHDTQIGTLSA